MNVPCIYVLRHKGSIVKAIPPGCTPSSRTIVEERETEKVEYGRENGFCVVREPKKAVLPEKACDILDSVSKGETPRLLLLGPPGTGKSLTLKLAAKLFPGHVVMVEPEALFNQYVGQTERSVYEVFNEAEANQPSLIAIDEGDLFIEERGSSNDAYGRISANVVRIFLRKLQELYNSNARVGVIVTSNKSVRALDTALLRGERFDDIIYFPVPTPDSIRLLAKLYGKEISEEEIRRLVEKALTFSNISHYIRTGELKEFRVANFAKVEYYEPVEVRLKLGDRARVVIAEHYPLSCKLAAVIASSVYRKPLLVLIDANRLYDLVFLGQSMQLPIAIPYSSFIADTAAMLVYDYDYPVFFCGEEWSLGYLRLSLRELERWISIEELADRLGCEASDETELLYCLSGFISS